MDSSLPPLLRRVCAFFDLGPLLGVSDAGGYANQNLVIQTGAGFFVARILREHGSDELRSERAYLQHLTSRGYPAPRYLAGRNGAGLLEADGRSVALMPLLEGKPPDRPSAAQIGALGQALASLHLIDAGPLTPRRTWWRGDFLDSGLVVAKQRFGEPALARLEHRIAKLAVPAPAQLPESIVHGDPWPGNALFDSEGLVALIDWEETSLGSSILDLAYLALHGCISGDEVDQEGFRSLIEAYQAVRPLSSDERSWFGTAVRWVACVNYLWLTVKAEPGQGGLEALWASEWYWSLPLDRLSLA